MKRVEVDVINNDLWLKPEDLAEEINKRLQNRGTEGWVLKDIKSSRASLSSSNFFNISILIFEKEPEVGVW